MKNYLPKFVCGFAVLVSVGLVLSASLPQVTSGSWVAVGPMNSARSGASTVELKDGRILVIGGNDASGPTSTAEFFGANASFSLAAPMNVSRSGHVSVLLQDGRVLVAGGTTSGGGVTNSAEIFDPAASAWTNVAGGMIEARSGLTATLLKDGRVLFAGGAGSSGTVSLTVEIFDPAAQTFTSAGQLSSARKSHAAALLSDGRVLIVGGSDGVNILATSDIYDPTAGAISSGPKLSAARQGLSATTLLDGRVLIAGGNNLVPNPDGGSSPVDLASAEILDAGAGAFSPAASALLTARSGHQAFLLPHNNSVLIVGGTSNGSAIASAELFIPWGGSSQAGIFQATGLMTTARSGATGSALQQDGLLLVAGGKDASGVPLSSSELYGFAAVKTDAADYPPGTTVNISGSGWQAGETVTLTLVESPLIDTHGPYTVTADANGNISDSSFTTDAHDLLVKFTLTAVGSVSQAQTTFTDGKANTVTVASPTSATVAPGGTATYGAVTITFNGTFNSMNPSCTVALGATGLPTGATAAFGTNPITSTGSDITTTFSITTTPGGTSATPTGTYTLNVTATDGTGCQDTNIRSSNNLTLIVTAPIATSTSITAPAITYGANGTVTVTVSATPTPTGNVTLSVDSGTPVSKTLSGGSATFTSTDIPALTLPSAGSHSLTASYAPQNGFAASSVAGSLTVTPRAITVTAAANSKPYDGNTSAAAAPTITSGTLATGDAGTFTETYDNKNVAGSPNKTMTPTGTVKDSGSVDVTANYNITFSPTNNGTITARAITVTAAANSKPYDGNTSAAAAPTITSGTLATGDAGTFTETYDNKNVAGSPNKTMTPTGAVKDSGSVDVTANYNITFSPTNNGTITARGITVTAAANSKPYDGNTSAAAAPTITSGTLATGDAGTFTETYDNKNVAGSPNKTMTPTGAVKDSGSVDVTANYNITFSPTNNGTITARAITVTAAANSKPYDGNTSAAAAPTITSGTLATGDAGTFTETYDNKNVAGSPNKTMTPTGAVKDSGSVDVTANYNITFTPTNNGTITARAITVTAAANSKPYDGNTSAAAAPTITSGTLATGDAGTFTETYDNKNVAGSPNKTMTPTGTVEDPGSVDVTANYNITFTPTNNGTITARAITVTAAANSKPYDGNTSAAAAPTITSGTLATGDVGSFTETYDNKNVAGSPNKTMTPTGTVKDSGSVDVTANYNITFSPTNNGTITARAITVTAAANSKPYDGNTSAAAAPTITSGTLATGDVGSFTETYDNKNVAGSPNKTMTPTGAVKDSGSVDVTANYNITFTPTNNGTITARAITVTAAANSKPYDGNTSAAAAATITSGTLATGDVGTFTETYDNKNVAGSPNKTMTPTGTVKDSGSVDVTANYNITFTPTNNGTITARAITVTAAANSKPYDGNTSAAAAPTITSGTLATGDVGTFTETYDNKNVAGSPNKTMTPTGAVKDSGSVDVTANYNITFTPTNNGTITARAITVTAAANSKPYDGNTSAAAAPTITSGTLATGDVGTFTETYDNKNVAGSPNKTMTPTGTVEDSGSVDVTANYNITFTPTNNGTITARAITVTAAANSKPYDGNTSAAAAPTITSGTLATGDAGTFTETYDNKNVAGSPNKTMTPTGTVKDSGSVDVTANYNITFSPTNNGTITARAITVTAAANSKPYDGNTSAAAAPTITSGTLATGDVGTFTETYDNKNVAGSPNKTMTPTGTVEDPGSVDVTANYNITFTPTNNGTITARAITVTAAANSKPYDGNTSAAAAPTITSGTLATGDAGTFTETYDNKNVAGSPNKTMTPTGAVKDSGSVDVTANYNITFTPTNNGTIIKVDASITVTPYSVPYDTTAHTASGTATGVGGVDLSGDLNLTNTTHTNAGTYSTDYWTFTDATGNYNNVGNTTITDTISKVNASITVTPYSVPYDTTAHTASGTATGVGGVDLSGDLNLTNTTHTNAGTYSTDYWTFTDATGNYNNVGNTTITDTISKVNASITVTPYSVPYDTTAHTASGTATGVGGVDLSGDLNLTNTTHTNAGTYSTDYWTFTDATGNYNNVGNTTITDTISKVNASITVTPYSVPYDTTAHTASGAVTGVGGVDLSGDLNLTNTTHTNAGTYSTDYWTFTDATGNYNNVGNTTITDTISKVNASITVTPYGVPYDTTAHTASGTATGVGGVDLSGDLNLTNTTHTNAGTYSTDYWTFTDATGNYNNVGNTTITDTISKVNASITVTPYRVPYDTTAHTASGTATGVGGVDLSGDLNLTNTTHTNAGTYSTDYWTFTDATGNYNNVGNTTITDTISKVNASITVTPYGVPYDTTAHTASGTATGVGGVDLSGDLDLSHTTHTHAGTYSTDYWTFTDATGNYNNVGNTTITDTISKVNASITVTPYSVPYDTTAHTASGTATGVGNVDLSGDLDLSHTTHTHAGTYSTDYWTFTDATGNYNDVGNTTITDTITKVLLTATWANPANITYGTALSATQLDASFSWVVNGSTLTVGGTSTYTPPSGTVLNVGQHQALAVSFTPTDTTDFNSPAVTTVYINVNYGFVGFQTPYAPPPMNFNVTRTMPLKWQYTNSNGAVVNSAAANPVLTIQGPYACGGTDSATDITVNDAGSSGYQYDTTTNTWQFNWQIKGNVAGCYNIYVDSQQSGQMNGAFPISVVSK